MEDKNIEIFHDQLEVMTRVKELKKLGYKEEDMYIISGDDQNISMLRGSTDIMIKEDEGSMWDRFKSFIQGQDSISEAFTRMGLNDEDKEFYQEQIEKGKIILYIDKNHGSYYELHKDGQFRPVVSSDKKDIELDNVLVENEEILGKSTAPVETIPDGIKKDIGIETSEGPSQETVKDLIIESDKKPIR